MRQTGAGIAVKALEANGVKVIFGYPGASNAPLVDAISFSDIDYVLARNEQGACHMASGYARVKHCAGVCTATSGPGATNLITALATAYMDSIPVIALTGQVESKLVGKDAFQEVDIIGATLPFTKHSYLLKDAEDIPRIVNEAFHIATTGRPGPVLIDFPVDVLQSEYKGTGDTEINLRGYKLPGKANEAQVRKVADAVKAAERPVILAGGGITSSGAEAEVGELAARTEIPVVSTMMGTGVIPTDDNRYFGMIGSHGSDAANGILNRADLVIALGTRLGDRATAKAEGLEASGKLIHVDIDPAEIGKNIQPSIPVVGDIKDVVEQLMPLISDYKADEAWVNECVCLRDSDTQEAICEDGAFVNPKYFLERLSDITDSEIYMTTEVGQNQIWCIRHFNIKQPDHFLTSGGFGTMGYGLPAAIGASKAQDELPVVAVAGDGSFQMDMAELGTMTYYGIPVKIVIFKNDRLGMVHELQHNVYNANYNMVDITGSPDFNILADAYGIRNARISKNSEVDAAIRDMMSDDKSFLLVADVDPYESTLTRGRFTAKEE